MDDRNLLPGVVPESAPPVVVCSVRKELLTARRRAWIRDALVVTLMVAVDYLFVRFPATRIPMLDRETSLLVLAALNALVVTQLLLSRLLPRWRANRIARSWSADEKTRFQTQSRRR